MKKALLITTLWASSVMLAIAQGKYESKNTVVSFHSEAPMENIDATNKAAQGVLDSDKSTFFFRIPIKSFVFPSSLMQDHFNENYLESEKFPNAQYKGTFSPVVDLKKEGTQTLTTTGELNVHGVAKQVTIPVTITVSGGKAKYSASFKIKLADHNITIPTMVFNKIAEVVDVKIEGELAGMK